MSERHRGVVDRFRQVFQQDGLGEVETRLAVLEEFLECEGHVGAEEVAERLAAKGTPIEAARVHACLEGFVNYGLAARREFEGLPHRYEHLHPGRHHDHMICVRCGTILEIANARLEELQDRLVRRQGLRPLAHRLEVYGLCRACDSQPDRLVPLSAVPEGSRARIGTLTGGRGLQARLVSMGLNPGSEVEVISNTGPGPFIVGSRGSRIALGYGLARRVFVDPIAPAAGGTADVGDTPAP